MHGSASTGRPKNYIIIVVVVAIVIVLILATAGLANFCIKRKRRRWEIGIATAGEKPQMYFQQKAELDDEQQRHEMEAVEVRYEMEGESGIHEIRHSGRQELRGEDHSKELDNG